MNTSPDLIGGWGFAVVVLVGAGIRPRPSARRVGRDSDGPNRNEGADDRRPRRRHLHRHLHRHLLPALARRRSPSITADEVATWCDRLARALRTGATSIGALREVEPPDSLGVAMDAVRHDLDRGQGLDQALGHLPEDPHVGLAVTALTACRANGLDGALPLEQVATVLRWRAADAAELRSQTAQAKASSKVMTILPLAMLALLVATSTMVRAAVATPAGLTAATLGVVLNLSGWAWMQRLIGRATR